MFDFFFALVSDIDQKLPAGLIAYVATLVSVVAVGVLANLLVRFILVKIAGRVVKHTKYLWDDILFEQRLFHRLGNFTFPVVMQIFAGQLTLYDGLYERIVGIVVICMLILLVDSLMNSIDRIYRQHEISKIRPISALLQVIKIAIMIIGAIVGIAILLGESPVVLIGGLSAMTAVISLIFKDAILGFVAGIQLTANDMIRIGDWIEVPGQNANGDVIELSMTTVKVQNWDKTITCIPAYSLISDAFINWRGMKTAGGRRIKRAVYLSAVDIRLCDDEMLERLQRIELLRDYFTRKLPELDQHNYGLDPSIPVNVRRLTNIGTFRAYITAYLEQHPGVHHGMTCMVRQTQPDDRGLPLEIYCFTNTTDWVEYEGIQADIFDHLYAVAGEFGLSVYQKPSGVVFVREQ